MHASQPFDVIIVGAGPAGTACALQLGRMGIKTALIDRSTFPRDKVCGDAIGGRVRTVLNLIDPKYHDRLEKFPLKAISAGWKLVAPNGKEAEVRFTRYGYVSKRSDFDHFLLDLVKENTDVCCMLGKGVTDISFRSNGVQVILDDGQTIQGSMIIGCDGAHSIVQKQTVGREVDEAFYSGAIRQYWSGISGMQKDIIEIHLIKGYLPGYFWIFPLPNDLANVGFGMLSKDISRRKIDLKKGMAEIIQSSSGLANRFRNATAMEKPKGFGLPLGGKKNAVSGERFLLCGDAASLIDPLNGEGIGNAMLSGYHAALTAGKAIESNDFSKDFLYSYDIKLNEKLIPELRQKFRFQRLFNRPWLINTLVTAGSYSPALRNAIGKRL